MLGEIDFLAEFRLQPALEAMRRGRADLVVHQQHVLAPLDRLVAAAEHLMRPRAAEEIRLSKLARIGSLSPEKPSVTSCSSQNCAA